MHSGYGISKDSSEQCLYCARAAGWRFCKDYVLGALITAGCMQQHSRTALTESRRVLQPLLITMDASRTSGTADDFSLTGQCRVGYWKWQTRATCYKKVSEQPACSWKLFEMVAIAHQKECWSNNLLLPKYCGQIASKNDGGEAKRLVIETATPNKEIIQIKIIQIKRLFIFFKQRDYSGQLPIHATQNG